MQSSSIFPEEIMVGILLRLPAKSIGRCRCVSKPWRSLLSQPQFIKTHQDRIRKLQEQSLTLVSDSGSFYSIALTNAHHLFDEITEPARRLSFAGHPDSWDTVLASCDGLVLVKDMECKKFLVNPVTREIKEVLPSRFDLDPFARYTVYGLGYDSVNDDYKIITLSYYYPGYRHEPNSTEMFVNVYSIKDGTWKKAENSPYDHVVGFNTSGVFVDGYIHWLASKTIYGVIAAFDLAEEKFYEVPPPRSIGRFELNSLVNLGGYLCMFRTSYHNGNDVWIMKEYGNKESWTKFTIIDPEGAEFKPLSLLGQQQMVLVKNEGTTEEKLVKYNLEKGTFQDIMVHGISDDFQSGRTFIESLVSPHCCNETR